jgi:hypothetical protein
MNERIKELLLKAGWDRYEALDERNQKFAELIVRECADISNQAERQCQHPGTQILKHFGVEE